MSTRRLVFQHRELNGRVFPKSPLQHGWDVDLVELYVDADGAPSEDLRAFIVPRPSGLCALIYVETLSPTMRGEMREVMFFPEGTTMADATQWLWTQVAVFNADTGALDVGNNGGRDD